MSERVFTSFYTIEKITRNAFLDGIGMVSMYGLFAGSGMMTYKALTDACCVPARR